MVERPHLTVTVQVIMNEAFGFYESDLLICVIGLKESDETNL